MHGSSAVDADVLVECLSKLLNQTDLRLGEKSELFVNRHIVPLTGSLPKLEGWSTPGYRLKDDIWDEFLRRLYLEALTSFTADDIFNSIEKLRPSNEGLALSVTNQGENSNLSPAEQESISRKPLQRVKIRLQLGASALFR